MPVGQELVADFIGTALGDLRCAENLLKRHPEIGHAGFHVALVLGDAPEVARRVRESPGLATATGGPRQWQPILYVCFSRFAKSGSALAAGFAETVQLLLAHGADPNASCVDARWPESPLSCLYAATGLNNNPALARVLLDAGALPDDSESLYHSTEHGDLVCLRLLLEYGASPRATNALKHMLDREQIEGVRLLLAAGADPNEINQRGETALHWAVWRGRGAQIIAELLDAGADLNARRKDGRTAYTLAVISGQCETAALLKSRGADENMPTHDRLIGDYVARDPLELSQRLVVACSTEIPLPPEYNRLLPEFAASHFTAAVRALLAIGVPVDTRGDNGGTALHWACWKGYADLAKILIESGASLAIEDTAFHAPPAGWFSHGLENCGEGEGDYPQVARLLLKAGATIAARDMPTGNGAVDAILQEHGLI